MFTNRKFRLTEIEWVVSRMHINTSDYKIAKNILSRTKNWEKKQRKLAVKFAIRYHHRNKRLFYFVMTGI